MQVNATPSTGTSTDGQQSENSRYSTQKPSTRRARRDTVSLSSRSPRVKNLQNQKRQISQKRNRLIQRQKQQQKTSGKNANSFADSVRERGESLSAIRIKLLHYTHKMRMIDDQIAKALRDDVKAQVEKALDKNTGEKPRPDAESERLARETGLGTHMHVSRSVNNARAKAYAQAKELEEQIAREQQQGKEEKELTGKRMRLKNLRKKAE